MGLNSWLPSKSDAMHSDDMDYKSMGSRRRENLRIRDKADKNVILFYSNLLVEGNIAQAYS